MAYMVYRRKEKPVAGVIFDMDGVLLDTEKLYARFWREAAVALGYPMTHQQALGMRSLNGQAGQAKLESYFGPGISRSQVRHKRIELMDAYIDIHGVELMGGVREILTFLKQRGIATAIATSSPRERVERYLAPYDLLPQFDALCSGYDVPQGKPAPDIYLKAAAMIGLQPEQCLAVEDSPAGILSASRAGCRPVFVPDQDQADEETMQLLYAHADSLMDIITMIEEEQP